MKITRTITAECCGTSQSFPHEYQALRWARLHIRSEHPTLFKQHERKGRIEARSQNGLGYFDSDSQKKTVSGWAKSPQTFRDAWIEGAIKREACH